jgi:hypothetical protein
VEPGTKFIKKERQSNEELRLPYRELLGSLTYLSTTTRPDISFAVSHLGQFNNCYGKEHWTAAKRVLRYLKGTTDLGLVYDPDSGWVDFQVLSLKFQVIEVVEVNVILIQNLTRCIRI